MNAGDRVRVNWPTGIVETATGLQEARRMGGDERMSDTRSSTNSGPDNSYPKGPLSRDEATWVKRPEPIAEPWSWSEPIGAIVNDSGKFKLLHAGEWTDLLELCQGFLNNLYDRGWALVKVEKEVSREAREMSKEDVHE